MRKIGGLLKDLKPNAEIRIKNTQYVVRNVGLYPIRLQIYISQENDKAENTRTGGQTTAK